MPAYRSRTTTEGTLNIGARALWRATGLTDGDFGKPIIAVVNSFVEFVPGHVHLRDLGRLVGGEIRKAGGVPREFNTIAVDDGIACTLDTCDENPDKVNTAPHSTAVRHLDEYRSAHPKTLTLSYKMYQDRLAAGDEE